MRLYTWYRSPNVEDVAECASFMDRVHGGPLTAVRCRVDDNDMVTDPPLYGVAVGKGSDAGTVNIGANAVQAVRDLVVADQTPMLTSAERGKLMQRFGEEEDVDLDWHWDVNSPDYGLTPP